MKNKEPVIVMEYEIPVSVITPKLAENRTDSFFYAGHNIAVVKNGKKEYVLTTAGQYVFRYKDNVYNSERDEYPLFAMLPELTDRKIKMLKEGNHTGKWGWFVINVWQKKEKKYGGINVWKIEEKKDTLQLLNKALHVSSNYDEAMNNFITFVHNDIISDIIAGLILTDEETTQLIRRYTV